MGHSWKEDNAKKRIATRFEEVRNVEIVDYTRDMSLENIPAKKAYRVDAVHIYIDIVNMDDILGSTVSEGEQIHKRTLRFLNQHYRAVHRILAECDVIPVDFHNQRLHAVVAKPYGENSEVDRVAHAIAIAQLISDVLAETGDADEKIPNATVRIGIDSGRALVVNNGRRGGREPLFLGNPANQAAKCAGAGKVAGIYLTNTARSILNFNVLEQNKDRITPLTHEQIAGCVAAADLEISKEEIIEKWFDEHTATPIGSIEFSRPTPPLSDLDIELLTVANSKRFDGVSVYADIDGFTAFVEKNLDENPENLVRTLHVLRSELDAVVHTDFAGRRIRFIGDCIHGLLLEGTAYTTDIEETISTATLCAGALRSSFTCAIDYLRQKGVNAADLGLAIGVDFGPISVTRLGMKGAKIRCAMGRAVLSSENEQRGCTGIETAIGAEAYKQGSDAVRVIFTAKRKSSGLDYDSAVTELAASDDQTAKAIQREAYKVTTPAILPSLSQPLRPHSN